MHFLIFLVLHFHIFKIKLQLICYINLLGEVRWLVTWWWVQIKCISSDSNLTQNITRETVKVEEKEIDQHRTLTHSRVNATLRICLALLDNSYSSTTKKWINKKKHLTINNIKLNFLKKTSSMFYPVKKHLKCQGL